MAIALVRVLAPVLAPVLALAGPTGSQDIKDIPKTGTTDLLPKAA